MNLRNSIIFFGFLLVGCSEAMIKPDRNKPFSETYDLKEYEGTYKNRGEPYGFLSRVLWGGDYSPFSASVSMGKNQDEDIKFIQINVKDKKIILSAIGEKCVLFTKVYLEGTDFNINDGQINLTSNIGHTLDDRNVVIGVKSHSVSIGLDTDGHGKFKSSGSDIGLAYFIIPVAVGGTEEVRFRKSKKTHNYNTCK